MCSVDGGPRIGNLLYLRLRGLKFIPSLPIKFAKQDILKDFDEFCRKLRCRYLYHNNMHGIHPFQLKSGYRPHLFVYNGMCSVDGGPRIGNLLYLRLHNFHFCLPF
jgi:hypothetical protein